MKSWLVKNIDPDWRKVFSKYVSEGKKQKALETLDNIILSGDNLFGNLPKFQNEKRTALLLRIDLLRLWKRDLEALAWLALACDLHPENKTAFVLKDHLKSELQLKEFEDNEKSNFISQDDLIWEDFPGMRELKTILVNDVINPIKNPSLYEKYKITPPNGIIFYGPSGCGKTFIARKIAKMIDYKFIEVRPSDLASIYVHGTQQKIQQLFDKAIDEGPSVIFIDEFDGIAPKRTETSHSYRNEVNELLTQLDNLNELEILVIAATNLLSSIDEAVLRPGRFDMKIFIPPPDFESRFEIIKHYMQDRFQEKIDFIMLAEYTEMYTAAELRNLIDISARKAANNSVKINTQLIVDVILENPPNLTEKHIEKYKNEN
jgi:transitional endoplasmic reticulum ATPase